MKIFCVIYDDRMAEEGLHGRRTDAVWGKQFLHDLALKQGDGFFGHVTSKKETFCNGDLNALK